MLVQANEHHASIDKSPVRKPGISYIEVSLHRGDMMDLRYWQPLKTLFDDLGERFVPELSCDNSGMLCVLWDFHKKKLGVKIRTNRKGDFLEVPYYIRRISCP